MALYNQSFCAILVAGDYGEAGGELQLQKREGELLRGEAKGRRDGADVRFRIVCDKAEDSAFDDIGDGFTAGSGTAAGIGTAIWGGSAARAKVQRQGCIGEVPAHGADNGAAARGYRRNVVLNKVVAAAERDIVYAPWHSKHAPVVVQCHAGGDKAAPFGFGFHHKRAVGKPGDYAVAAYKVDGI